MKILKLFLVLLITFSLAACSAVYGVVVDVQPTIAPIQSQPVVQNTPAVTSATTPNSTQTPTPTVSATTPSPTPASVQYTDLILEAKWWATAQFPVFDEEAMAKKMNPNEIETSLNFPVVIFYPTSNGGNDVPILAPYDGVVQIANLGDASHSETVIQFAKVDGVWDGNWDTEKFYQPSAFPISVSAEKITPAQGINSSGTAVKRGDIVGYLNSFETRAAEFVKNPGPLVISAMHGTDFYKSASSPYDFLSRYLGYN